ncbi:MAG: hypothetical protein KC618_00830 [Candidatus Omnitrophica bacterium]|nr:hypothetical protein [Candidatus Omnitrophota bacterium]
MIKFLKNIFSSKHTLILFFLIISLWIFLFSDFFSGHLRLIGDAIPYYENTKFYLDQLGRGVMPLWDHTRNGGAPYEFFLRRIGEFNPFYFFIIILSKLGLSFYHAYATFLTIYYMLGVFGFYCVINKILKNQDAALLGAVTLMFSCFSAILFRSFIVLVFNPLIWFLYFAICFCDSRNRRNFMGMVFCLMLLLTTYIPFYALTILIIFALCCAVFYREQLLIFLRSVYDFAGRERMIVIVGMVLLFLSVLPGLTFFADINGAVVLPDRHEGSMDTHPLSVVQQTVALGGTPALSFAYILPDLKGLRVGDIYLPVITFLLFAGGLFLKTGRRFCFGLMFLFILYWLSLYDATPIYPFLYKYGFFFKYIRNFQFFLWIGIIPIFIFMALDSFCRIQRMKEMFQRKAFVYVLVFCIILQGVFVIRAMVVKASQKVSSYRYEDNYADLLLPDTKTAQVIGEELKAAEHIVRTERSLSNMYIGTPWMNDLGQRLDPNVLQTYQQIKLLLYDQAQYFDPASISEKDIKAAFIDLDKALVELREAEKNVADSSSGGAAQIITKESTEVMPSRFNANELVLKTNLNKSKFLVYNDSFHPDWNVEIDGKAETIYRANLAFKGVWLPAGEHIVRFHYGKRWQYLLKVIVLAAFTGLFMYLIYLQIRIWRYGR